MGKEIFNCLVWYANKVAETVQYTEWNNEACRKHIAENTKILGRKLSKYVDWNNFTKEVADELMFGIYATEEEINKEIKKLKDISESKEKTSIMFSNGNNFDTMIKKLERMKKMRSVPLYLYSSIPIGTKLLCDTGDVIIYDGTNLKDWIGFGCTEYWIEVKDK